MSDLVRLLLQLFYQSLTKSYSAGGPFGRFRLDQVMLTRQKGCCIMFTAKFRYENIRSYIENIKGAAERSSARCFTHTSSRSQAEFACEVARKSTA
jgi:hypothetical protein